MFSQLTSGLANAFQSLMGLSHFTEDNTKQAFREIRLALLEADVALPVVSTFIEQVKQKTFGEAIPKGLTPDQALIQTVDATLIEILGAERVPLDLKAEPPAVFLLAGLQGSGKTTTAAKLALHLKEIEKKKTMLVSLDVYRPAAIEQLQILARQLDLPFFAATSQDDPREIAKKALIAAKNQYVDVVIFDTAGRLHIDETLMAELKAIHKILNPIETLFVVDAMTGQDAANTAKVFHESLALTGVILTKTDGDARGGAALSIRQITGCPIKFMGTGEKIDALDPFYPDRLASSILGMGDILSLIDKVKRTTDEKTAEALKKKLKKGKAFNLEDYKQQLQQMEQMGGIQELMTKLPGLALPQEALNKVGSKTTKRDIAIINSMTLKEKRIPKIIVGSRKKRIAAGSGTQIAEVNRVLKQYAQIETMMLKFNKPGSMNQMMRMASNMPGLKNLLKNFMPSPPTDD